MRNRVELRGAPEPIAALNRVKIVENSLAWQEREPLVDIRTYCPEVVCVERICPYLRVRVADRLNLAQNTLPAGYRLKVGTALRTLGMQKGGWDGYHQRLRDQHPEWPLSALRRATNKYYAPYDQKAPPGHCTGGAVDVGLLNPAGESLDLIAPTEGWQAAYTWSDKISLEAKANRMLMVEAMLSAGFSNCRDEYWHYSYGDSAWAVRMGESECPYGWTYAPVLLEAAVTPEGKVNEQAAKTEKDRNGKPLSVEAACHWPLTANTFDARLLWARHVPTTLTVLGARTTPPVRFYVGDGTDEKWQDLHPEEVRQDKEAYILELLPEYDRTLITTRMPEPVTAQPQGA